MPRGHKRSPARARAIDLATAGACIDVARRVQRARLLAGDETGAEVALQVARSIEEALLKGALKSGREQESGSWS
jgi:hypothetical protein